MQEDFSAMLLSHPKVTTQFFELETNNLREKWDRVFNGTKVDYETSEKFWNYFFATKVISLRNMYFPDWKKAKHDYKMKNDSNYALKYENYIRAKEYNEMLNNMYDDYFDDFFKSKLSSLMVNHKVDEAKDLLGLSKEDDLTKESISSQYRMMSLHCHPDATGSKDTTDQFIAITEARDILLKEIA
jgi:hypothetical protein